MPGTLQEGMSVNWFHFDPPQACCQESYLQNTYKHFYVRILVPFSDIHEIADILHDDFKVPCVSLFPPFQHEAWSMEIVPYIMNSLLAFVMGRDEKK